MTWCDDPYFAAWMRLYRHTNSHVIACRVLACRIFMSSRVTSSCHRILMSSCPHVTVCRILMSSRPRVIACHILMSSCPHVIACHILMSSCHRVLVSSRHRGCAAGLLHTVVEALQGADLEPRLRAQPAGDLEVSEYDEGLRAHRSVSGSGSGLGFRVTFRARF